MSQPTTVQSIRADVETMDRLKQIAASMGCTQGQALKTIIDAWVDPAFKLNRLTTEITALRREIEALRTAVKRNRTLPAWRTRK